MSDKSKKLAASELLSTQSNAGDVPPTNSQSSKVSNEEPEKNTELISRVRIDKTPFDCIGNTEVGYFLALGRFRVSEKYETPYEATMALEGEMWNVIINSIGAIASGMEEHLKEEINILKSGK